MNQIDILYTLNLYIVICQIFFNKKENTPESLKSAINKYYVLLDILVIFNILQL